MGVKLRTIKLKDGGKSFYLDITAFGDRWKETLNIYGRPGNMSECKQQAESIRAKRELEIAAEAQNTVAIHKKHECFLEYFRKYSESYKKKDKRTVVAAYLKFNDFRKGKKISFTQLTTKVCESFKEYLIEDAGLKGESPFNYYYKFKKAIKDAAKDNYIVRSPAEFISISKSDGDKTEPKKVLEPYEVVQLIKTPCNNSDVYRAFLFCCGSGLRTPEAREFNPTDIQHIKVTERNNEGKIISERIVPHIEIDQNKGSNPRPKLIPLDDFLIGLLGYYDPESKEPFFKLKSQNAVNKSIKKWIKDAGIKKHITFYCARHTFGTELVGNNVDLRSAIALMGHSSFKYIMRYAHEKDVNKVKAVSLIGSLYQPKNTA